MLTNKDYCDQGTIDALFEIGIAQWRVGYDLFQQKNTLSLYEAQQWLRDVKNVVIAILPCSYNCVTETWTWSYEIWMGDNYEIERNYLQSYEEALLEGIKEAIKILKEE